MAQELLDYSAGVAVAWAVVFIVRGVIGGESTLRDTSLIFGGFAVAWVSLTIARYVYPPPKRWHAHYRRGED